jgi:hypothetical protein
MPPVCALIVEDAWRDAVIYDMRAVESASLLLNLPNLVPVVAGVTATHGPQGPVAVLVCSSDCIVWRQRITKLFHPTVVIDAFSDVAAAHRWLDTVHPDSGRGGDAASRQNLPANQASRID